MCIRTVMTYASPVFAHAAQKHYIDYRDLELPTISKYMKDASKRFFDIAGSHPNALLRAAVDYQPPHPTLSVGHETYLPIHLTLLQRQKALMTSTTRMTDLEEGNRPVTVSCDILCRDDFHQASSIAHVTRRRHSHVPSGRTRGFQSTLPTRTGARVCRIDIFTSSSSQGKQKKKELRAIFEEQNQIRDSIETKSRTRSNNGFMSEIGIESRTESRIKNEAKIKSETGTEVEDGSRIDNAYGIKCVTGIAIENDIEFEVDINRYKGKKLTCGTRGLPR
ncbi:hypothetical protein EVAR_22635_1 [Eumeta japonica]|uniref:Uncharacterized protein n=1 Tax=Eumeta variegata TaxID=151549 RepID=A0A4C1VL10_EUMVA|nr:hypothetical protein EVAR_22635_1 [Eumeta japonica]